MHTAMGSHRKYELDTVLLHVLLYGRSSVVKYELIFRQKKVSWERFVAYVGLNG